MIVLLVVVGVFSGVIAGMGMGGGTLLIPILTIFFDFKQQLAQGINLLAFLPCAIVSLIIHCKNKLVNFKIGIPIICSGVVASVLGSVLAMKLNSVILKKIFGGFLLIIGIFQLVLVIISIMKNRKKSTKPKKYRIVIGNRKSL